MNERILELATQAGLYSDWNGTPWPRGMSTDECTAAYEKFSKLLVKECILRCYANDHSPSYEAARRIAEHFGVEE